ncbi:MAG: hypothetical protein ACJAXJ_003849 [Colwellia sp.]|jgi:hypothetical protein
MENVAVAYRFTTEYHLINFFSYIYKKNDIDKIIFFVDEHWGHKTLTLSKLKEYTDIPVVIKLVSDFDLRSLVSVNCIYFASISDISYKPYFYLRKTVKKFLIVEDGLGTYAGRLHWTKVIYRERGIYLSTRYFLSSFFKRLLFLFVRKKKIKFLTLFNLKSLSQNSMFIKELRSYYLFKNKTKLISIFKPTVIFVSGPVIERGILNEDEYNIVLNSLRDSCSDKELDFVIKKHPAEYAFDYNDFELLEDGSLEDFVFINSEHVVELIGFFSTALITCKVLFDTKSHYINYNRASVNNRPARIIKIIKNTINEIEL